MVSPAAYVLLDQIEAINGKVEFVPALVFEEEKIVLLLSQGKPHQTPVNSDPMVGMDHIIIDLKVTEGSKSIVFQRDPGTLAGPLFAKKLAFGDENQAGLGKRKTPGEIPNKQGSMPPGGIGGTPSGKGFV
jgi:hypothetical protein